MDESQHAAPTAAETAHSAGHGHEANTVRLLPIVLFGGVLIVLTIVVLLLMRGMFSAYSRQIAATESQPSPLAATRQPPPQPRLQVLAAQEFKESRAAEDAILLSYDWVDRSAGVVRLPIRRAIELLVQRGLPVHTED